MIYLIVAREKKWKKNELLNELRAHSPLFVGISLNAKKMTTELSSLLPSSLQGVPAIIRISLAKIPTKFK